MKARIQYVKRLENFTPEAGRYNPQDRNSIEAHAEEGRDLIRPAGR
jgi:hypothetical protein